MIAQEFYAVFERDRFEFDRFDFFFLRQCNHLNVHHGGLSASPSDFVFVSTVSTPAPGTIRIVLDCINHSGSLPHREPPVLSAPFFSWP